MKIISKNFLIFEDLKCIAAVNATSYKDNGIEFIFFNDDVAFISVPYNHNGDYEHIYTIVEGINTDNSRLKAYIGG